MLGSPLSIQLLSQEVPGLIRDLVLNQTVTSLQVNSGVANKEQPEELSIVECGVVQKEARDEQGSDRTKLKVEFHETVPDMCKANGFI